MYIILCSHLHGVSIFQGFVDEIDGIKGDSDLVIGVNVEDGIIPKVEQNILFC